MPDQSLGRFTRFQSTIRGCGTDEIAVLLRRTLLRLKTARSVAGYSLDSTRVNLVERPIHA